MTKLQGYKRSTVVFLPALPPSRNMLPAIEVPPAIYRLRLTCVLQLVYSSIPHLCVLLIPASRLAMLSIQVLPKCVQSLLEEGSKFVTPDQHVLQRFGM